MTPNWLSSANQREHWKWEVYFYNWWKPQCWLKAPIFHMFSLIYLCSTTVCRHEWGIFPWLYGCPQINIYIKNIFCVIHTLVLSFPHGIYIYIYIPKMRFEMILISQIFSLYWYQNLRFFEGCCAFPKPSWSATYYKIPCLSNLIVSTWMMLHIALIKNSCGLQVLAEPHNQLNLWNWPTDGSLME